ncbi:MAG: PTS sugar transporter subunit IIA [Candidatus Bathyarchaeia archaeon]
MHIVCLVGVKARDRRDAISQLNNVLFSKGYVKESHLDEVLKREEIFPTGLRLEGDINVALPHCDAEHVNELSLAVGILEKSVDFKQMGSPPEANEYVPVKVVFLLACNEKDLLLPYLQEFVKLFRNVELMRNIAESGEPERVEKLIRDFLVEESSAEG